MTNPLRLRLFILTTAVILTTFFAGMRAPFAQAQALTDPMPAC